MRRVGFVGLAAVFCSAGLWTSAQQPASQQQPPVFRGGVTLINVDVYPREGGRVVEGLKPEDFQIFEDGKPQKIEAFEFIRTQPNTPDAERRDPNTKEEGDEQAADPHNRVFVVYLDLYHTSFQGARDARRPLLDFLNRVIGPTDLFGVLTPEVPVRQLVFGRRTDTLAGEFTQNFFDWGLQDQQVFPRTPIEEQLFSYCGAGDELIRLHREDALMSSLEELMVHLGTLRDERKNVLLVSGGWSPRPRGQSALQNSGSGSIPRIGVTVGGRLGDTPMLGGSNKSFCDKQITRLSNIDFEQRFKDLLTSAQRANVSFYPMDVGGLRTFAPTASMRGVPNPARLMAAGQGQIDTLRVLADNTDGQAVFNTNDLNAGFRRIADELSAYYLLGYSSTNQAVDGKYRRIEVKINRPKISVTARRGYLAPSPKTVAAVAVAEAAAAVPATVAQELARLSRLRADTDLFSYAARGPAGVDIVAEISSQEVARGRWGGGADVRIALSRASGEPAVATARIEPGARAAIVHVPLADADLKVSRATVTVSAGAGSLESPVELPAAPTAPGLISDPICFRGTSSARIPLRPVADFQFRRTERLHVEWKVSAPVDQRAVRVLDRRGQPLAINATLSQPSDTIFAADLPLSALAEGDYLIEIEAKRGEQSEKRLIAFRIVR